MPENLKPEANGGLSNPSSPTVDEAEVAMRRLKIDTSYEPGQGVYPERKGEPDCIYFLRTGSCSYGSNCRFNHPSHGGELVNGVNHASGHPERVGQPNCEFYMKTGTCKYGPTCKYHHPKDRQADSPALLNSVGLPMRQDAEICRFYMRTGQCKYGYNCKYHHPLPATKANTSHVPVYGSGPSGSSLMVPSPATPSIGELSAASSSNATYGYNSLPVHQSYMPLYLSPPQNWSTFMGNPNPIPITSVVTTPASSGELSVRYYLPERPNKPECRNFMNNGSCKYGSECRYHHPREKVIELASNSIYPTGLPLRPGQPLCSYYSMYGICESGPNCNFHHPVLDGYSYGYVPTPMVAATAYSYSASYQIIPSPVWITKDNHHTSSFEHSFSTVPRSSKASIVPLHDESD